MARFVERCLAPLLLLSCLVLGGASAGGFWANAVLQIGSIIVVALLVLGGGLPALPVRAKLLLLLVALIAGLMCVQLVPMPEALWSSIPGRAEVARSLALADVHSAWLPISLAPDATIAGLLSLLPPLAMILAIYASSGHGRLYSAYALVTFTVVSLALGLAQKIQGYDSPLYVYAVTNRGLPVGLFANRNHLATLLLVTIPFVAALAVSPSRKISSDSRIGRRLIAACIIGLLVLGLVYVRSDAGWLLALPCLVASAALFQRGERGRLSRAWGIAALGVVVAAVLLALLAPAPVKDAGDKLTSANPQKRAVIVGSTLRAAREYLPLGSGGGSFPVIYPSYENPESASFEYINHAHSDYAEFLLEYGLPGVILLLSAFALWIRVLPEAWRSRGGDSGLTRAGCVAIALVAAHSLVDYPIRTSAIAAVMAMACALLVAPAAEDVPSLQAARRRQRQSKRTIVLGLAEPPPAQTLGEHLMG